MSDTVKVVIEIPKDYYKIIKHDVEHHLTDYRPFEIIGNGTPFDSVIEDIKAEIETLPSELTEDGRRTCRKCRVLEIIDKHISRKENNDT